MTAHSRPQRRAPAARDSRSCCPRTAAPVLRTPFERRLIDHLAGAEHVLGLERRSRIWHVDLVIYPEIVAAAGGQAVDFGHIPAVLAAPHGMTPFEQQIDASCS